MPQKTKESSATAKFSSFFSVFAYTLISPPCVSLLLLIFSWPPPWFLARPSRSRAVPRPGLSLQLRLQLLRRRVLLLLEKRTKRQPLRQSRPTLLRVRVHQLRRAPKQ